MSITLLKIKYNNLLQITGCTINYTHLMESNNNFLQVLRNDLFSTVSQITYNRIKLKYDSIYSRPQFLRMSQDRKQDMNNLKWFKKKKKHWHSIIHESELKYWHKKMAVPDNIRNQLAMGSQQPDTCQHVDVLTNDSVIITMLLHVYSVLIGQTTHMSKQDIYFDLNHTAVMFCVCLLHSCDFIMLTNICPQTAGRTVMKLCRKVDVEEITWMDRWMDWYNSFYIWLL